MTAVLLALAGGAGAVLRVVVDGWVRGDRRPAFPWGTLVVNLVGSAVVGLVAALGAGGVLGPDAVGVLAVGLCGGFTTFSAAMVETVRLLQLEDRRRAVIASVGQLLACVAAAALGVLLGGTAVALLT